MQLDTLNITKQQALEAVINYRRALKLKRNAEDEAVLRGYNQIIKGNKLIELSKIITAGGMDHEHRPRLAVIRADQKICRVVVRQNGSVSFHGNGYRNRGVLISRHFNTDTLPRWIAAPTWETVEATAIVPSVPPQFRPEHLDQHYILWEATWKNAPPKDPALLKHLGGDLYAVLAVWDLSPLEMAVLSGRGNG